MFLLNRIDYEFPRVSWSWHKGQNEDKKSNATESVFSKLRCYGRLGRTTIPSYSQPQMGKEEK